MSTCTLTSGDVFEWGEGWKEECGVVAVCEVEDIDLGCVVCDY